MALTQRQLEDAATALSIKNKSINFHKPTLKRFMAIYSNDDNQFLDTMYGEELIKIFLSNYQFKSYNDYVDVLNILKEQKFFNSNMTFYGHFNSVITNLMFDSAFVKTEWIIEHMSTNGSFAEINNVVRFIFSREKGNEITFLNQIIDFVKNHKKEIVVYEAIIRHGLGKTIEGLDSVFEKIFSKDPKIESMTIINLFGNIVDDKIRMIVGSYLYEKTKDAKFLPKEAQDIFIF